MKPITQNRPDAKTFRQPEVFRSASTRSGKGKVIGLSKVKEIWIYHHSHLDVGFTHVQPALWELQKTYIDQAIDLCEQTEHEPEEYRFRWTCEATAPVVRWLESASDRDRERFVKYVRNGQICITALYMHTAPLSGAEQLARMLYPAQKLRETLGVNINTAINHDINGQPWTLAQIMLDAGVELYTTGINIHFGGLPLPRPLVFRWQAPDGRELLTFNGEHYSVFTQFTELWEKSIDKMKKGIDEYLSRLEQEQYPYDFAYISSTNIPMFDNTPPDPELLEMIRLWNETVGTPKLRMATPEMLLEKIKSMPREQIPVYAGDWTDYWNFGAASSAKETRLTRRTKQTLKTAELLQAFAQPVAQAERKLLEEAWDQLHLYDEHTWGANESVTKPDSHFTAIQWMHKAHTAYQANSLSGYLMHKQLEAFAGNALQSGKPDGLLLVNPTHVPQRVDVRVSEEFTFEGRHTSANRFKYQQNNEDTDWTQPSLGTVELPPFGWKKIPFDRLRKADKNEVALTDRSMETAYYRLAWDPDTGRITELYDKVRNWQMIDPASEWTLFQYVRETVDPLKAPEHRVTLFPRDVVKCNNNISCWNHEWPPKRAGATRLIECRAYAHDSGATLLLKWEAPGVEWLEQQITLLADSPLIELTAQFYKSDIRTPESIYFVFPLQLGAWRAKFDTAGTFVELDDEQLPGSCRDYVTVDTSVSVFDAQKGVTLACPDAPMVQIGDFHFGKEQRSVPRRENPLLIAWPINNYWDMNFRANQPGVIRVKYALKPFSQFDPADALGTAMEAYAPVQLFPAVTCPQEEQGAFLSVDNRNVAVLHVKAAEKGNAVVLRIMNLNDSGDETAVLSFPGRSAVSAYAADMLENAGESLPIQDGAVRLTVPRRRLVTVKVEF